MIEMLDEASLFIIHQPSNSTKNSKNQPFVLDADRFSEMLKTVLLGPLVITFKSIIFIFSCNVIFFTHVVSFFSLFILVNVFFCSHLSL